MELSERLHPWLDRKLGYFGDARFVMFYWEPRGQEVMWNDGRSYGFGTGAWSFFSAKIAPLANRYSVRLGDGDTAGHQALVIDRVRRHAYFAHRDLAEAFLTRQWGCPPQ